MRVGVTPRSEAWSIVGVDADGALFWTWLSVGNTGLLDGQLTTRLLLLPAGPGIIEHRASWGPTTLGDDGVRGGADSLVAVNGGWELRVGGEGLGARVVARGARPGCPPEIGEMAGVVEDRVDGRLLSGPAIVTRTRMDGEVEGSALYVLGEGFAAAIEPQSDCSAWVRAGERVWTGDAADFAVARKTALVMGDWTLTFRSSGEAVVQDGWGHTLAAERLLARAFGFRPPRTEARRAVMRVEGPGLSTLAPALVIERL
ncbi:MAG: hypothetical protein Q8P18_17675 [Pseudomonadota bacterium]|nr:hypothetical protein [Pseudomonadota bacterium]